ncbi:unnamed protein product, partial [Rotaria sp. Silwood2]
DQRLDHFKILVNPISERMQTRISKDQNAKIHQDSSQIKSSFRNNTTLNTASNDFESVIKLVEPEIDLYACLINEQFHSLDLYKRLKTGNNLSHCSKTTTEAGAYKTSTMTKTCTGNGNLLLQQTEVETWVIKDKAKGN